MEKGRDPLNHSRALPLVVVPLSCCQPRLALATPLLWNNSLHVNKKEEELNKNGPPASEEAGGAVYAVPSLTAKFGRVRCRWSALHANQSAVGVTLPS